MNLKPRNGSRAIAALLLFSILQIGLQIGFAEPTQTTSTTIAPQLVGRLTTKNNQPVTVNGLAANTGASILSGATIETGADQSATIDLGPLGSMDVAPNTKVVLTFDEQKNVKVLVTTGCVSLKASAGTNVEITSEQALVGRIDPTVGGVLNNCSPPPSPAQSTGEEGGLFGLGRAATVAILAASGAAALTPLFFQDNPSRSNP